MITVVRRSAILLVALGTAACSLTNTGSPNAAAIVGDETIPVARINEQFDVIAETDAFQQSAQQDPSAAGQTQAQLVAESVQETLLREVAERNGVEVTEREIDGAVEAIVDQVGGQEELERRLDEVGMSQRDFRRRVTNQQVQASLQEQSGADDFGAFLREAAADIPVEVNPRYGAWSDQTFAITPVDPLAPDGARSLADGAPPVEAPGQ